MQPDYVIQLAGQGKDWVDYLTALFPIIIAAVVAVIAFMQWYTNRQRYKHELFDRRWEQYQAIVEFFKTQIIGGKTNDDDRAKLTLGTEGCQYLFDDSVKEYVEILCKFSIKHESIDIFGTMPQAQRVKLSKRKTAYRNYFKKQRANLDDKFKPYLKL